MWRLTTANPAAEATGKKGGAARAKSVTPEQRQEGAAKTVEENGLSGVIPASTKREFQGDALPAVGIN